MDKNKVLIKVGLLELIGAAGELGPEGEQMKRELGGIATRFFFNDRKYVQAATDLVKNRVTIRQLAEPQPQKPSPWGREWNPRQAATGKTINNGKKTLIVAGKAEEPNEQPQTTGTEAQVTDINNFAGWDAQRVIEHFGSTKNLKNYARELALPLKYGANAKDFIAAFIAYVDSITGTNEEE